MPDFQRTEPALCGHRQAPWLPLCEHAGQARASQLTDADIGRQVGTSAGHGVLIAVHHHDDQHTQLVVSRTRDDADVLNLGAGEVVRVGHPLPVVG